MCNVTHIPKTSLHVKDLTGVLIEVEILIKYKYTKQVWKKNFI